MMTSAVIWRLEIKVTARDLPAIAEEDWRAGQFWEKSFVIQLRERS